MDVKSDIVTQYSIAFVEALDKSDDQQAIFNNVNALYHATKANKEYIELLSSPIVENETKKELLDQLFDDKETTYLRNMLWYMVDKSDERYIVDVLKEIVYRLSKELNYVMLKITSAYEIAAQDINRIVEKVSAKLKKKVIPEVVIDPTYIAGISIEYDSYRVDNSIRGKLNEIKKNLLDVQGE